MKLSEVIKMEILNCDETNPIKIRKFLLDKIGAVVPIADIVEIQNELINGKYRANVFGLREVKTTERKASEFIN